MKIYEYDAIVIGTGCAGYNAADRLYEYGCKNIAIVTEGRMMGTSRNTGSDKQTYYKLSLAGNSGDSVYDMAQTLFEGGAMDGDIALCEAANSVPSFLKLANLGVQFPTNDYGEYVGYKTDHDPFCRATSIGPYTSKKMTEVLETSVFNKRIKILDDTQVIKLLVDEGAITGVLCIEKTSGEYVAIKTPHVIMATGGPAAIYFNSVYPESQTGSSALAMDAGAEFVNMSEWQYGLASIDFRWNVSGTYQQVLPRYISIDENGVEREFLLEEFETPAEMLKNIFLKGYEWPFDVRKIYGSSYIDLLVYRETMLRGRTVYMDFTREPTGLENGFDGLDEVSYEYLKNSEALLPLPINRLKKMNMGAISLYKEHGIDIEKEPLKIAVCAQHNNGGIRVNADWQTNVKGLYAAGECAGTFGIFRPGGTALNSSQVGSMRAARHIAYFSDNTISENFERCLQKTVSELDSWLETMAGDKSTIADTRVKYQQEMSTNFAFLRDINGMETGVRALTDFKQSFERDNRWKEKREIPDLIKNREIITTQVLTAQVMLETAKRFGSRGSAFVLQGEDFTERKPIAEEASGRNKILIATYKDGVYSCREEERKPLPERDLWFEKVWNKFNKDTQKR